MIIIRKKETAIYHITEYVRNIQKMQHNFDNELMEKELMRIIEIAK